MTKMKTKTLLYMALAAVMTTLAACSQDDDMQQDAAPEATPIEFEITDGGYGGNDATRAVEEGYRTRFEAGDECGLYIVNGGTLKAKNVKLTASEENGKLTWKPENGTEIDAADGDKYFLYYPYPKDSEAIYIINQANMNSAADKDDKFFENLISDWVVFENQNENDNYTQSDLMTAKGTATDDGGTLKLSFKLTHRMALAEIVAPVEVDFSNSINCTPYKAENWKYRLIVNPGKVEEGVYIKGKIGSKTFTINSTTLNGLTPGQYRTFKVGSSYYVDNDGVYHVYNDKGLRAWAAATKTDLSTSCTLENDITMPTDGENATNNWTPVGTSDNKFTGTFDGNGHTITELMVNSTEEYVGFIANNYGTVKSLTLKGAKIKGKSKVGGVAGHNSGTISDCTVAEDCSFPGINTCFGGITGYNENKSIITGCNVLCNLDGGSTVGGISGYDNGGSFTNCSFMGEYILGSDEHVGGIVGFALIDTTKFKECTYKNCEKGVGSENIDPDGITKM